MKKLIPLLLFFVALPSWAQRQFDIEVVVFKRSVNPEQTAESWPNNQPAISLDGTGTFSDTSFRARKGVQMLPYSSYKLNSEVTKLKKHAGFEVLMHKAWRQGDRGRLSAPTFHIQAGRDYSNVFNSDGSKKGSNLEKEVLEGVTETSIPKPLYELDGKLQIYVEHYLYADVELDLKSPSVREVVLQAPISIDTIEDTGVTAQNDSAGDSVVEAGFMEQVSPTIEKQEFLKSYRLDQKRRMRSSETHYLDHPLMGIIVQVRRVN
tara:strand:+ start:1126 stop:1917 length:792 start_codon:yes stop_codon:yes gene_type:complete